MAKTFMIFYHINLNFHTSTFSTILSSPRRTALIACGKNNWITENHPIHKKSFTLTTVNFQNVKFKIIYIENHHFSNRFHSMQFLSRYIFSKTSRTQSNKITKCYLIILTHFYFQPHPPTVMKLFHNQKPFTLATLEF